MVCPYAKKKKPKTKRRAKRKVQKTEEVLKTSYVIQN